MAALTPGSLIDERYRLEHELGSGGMGVVWAAEQVALGRKVAIKVLHPGVAGDSVAVERMLTEARVVGKLRHPGIVDVRDAGCLEDGSPYIVMERLDGVTLDRVFGAYETLRPEEILPIVRDLAQALSAAHALGVIHRDIKPPNIFLHRESRDRYATKLLDFGVAKVVGGPKLTQAGSVVGSPAYMAPEHASGRFALDERTDIWALGVVLFEALAGRLPYEEKTYNALLHAISVRPPPPLDSLVDGLPDSLITLVNEMLAHERGRRLPNALAVVKRVEDVLADLGKSRAAPVVGPERMVGQALRPARATMVDPAADARRRAHTSGVSSLLVAVAALVIGVVLAILVVLAQRWSHRAVPGGSTSPPSSSSAMRTSVRSVR